jgi:hypothetical protein
MPILRLLLLPFTIALILQLAARAPLHAAESDDAPGSRAATVGASSLNFTYSTALKNTGVLAGATGKLNGKFSRVGAVNNQQLTILLANLQPSTPYQLTAFLGSDTNATSVTTFTSDAKGKLKITFVKKDGRSSGSGKPLPDALSPLNNVRELDIAVAGQAILRADVTHADKFRYQFKGPLTNTGAIPAAAAILQLSATEKATKLTLKVAGLPAKTDFPLAINVTVTQKTTSDSKGKLSVKTLPMGSPGALGIHTVALVNNATGIAELAVKGLGIPPDNAAPTVLSKSPADTSTSVPTNARISVAFSKAVVPATITTSNFTVTGPGTTAVAGAIAYDSTLNRAIFTPSAALTPNTLFTAMLTAGIQDFSGNVLANGVTWTFTTGPLTDTTPPFVISTNPADGAAGAPINRLVTATFNKSMDASTLNSNSFTLQQGATTVAGSVTCTDTTATFSPATALAPNTTFTGTITTAVMDVAGDSMASNFTWSFTTGQATDASAPFVVSTTPANAATGVPINRPITATFNKAMNASTLNSATFTLQGATAVPGTVTYGGTTATFTPSSSLAVSTTFTGTITTAVTDLAGNPMASTFTWSFTTGTAAAAGPAPVAFGSANSFGVLAGSTVTNAGPTQDTGDLGVSPGSAVTGFPPGQVSGAIHAGDDAAAQAKNDLLSAYNDSAGRLGSAVLPGNLGGLTFTPGLYKNSTSTMISGTGSNAILTLDAQGDANAVFMFQMGSTLTTDAGTQVVLAGGAKANNIYWQVGSSATLGTSSIFKGNILADQSITLTTGVSLEGRALTRVGAVALDSNIITVPAP